MRLLVLLCLATGASLVYLLAQGPANTSDFTRHYPTLLGLGALLALGLVGLIARQLVLLRGKLRARMFGARLTLRLMGVFALMALVPGGLVYALSYQFIQKSIDSWFEVRIDRALEGGLSLARGALDQALREQDLKAADLAARLAAGASPTPALETMRASMGLDHVSLLDEQGRRLLSADAPGFAADHAAPEAQQMNAAEQAGSASVIDSLPDGSPVFRMVRTAPSPGVSGGRYLQVLHRPPLAVVADARAVESGWRDFERRLHAAESCPKPRRVWCAYPVFQHHDAPDQRRHASHGAQPTAARERQRLLGGHPLQFEFRRALLRRTLLLEDRQWRGL